MKNMKTVFAMVAVAMVVLLVSGFLNVAVAGNFVNNGGGLSEKNILFAYEKLEKYLQLCLSSESCKLTPRQKEILVKIKAGLPAEKHRAQIEFSSEKNIPGYFMIDGRVRIARTGSTIGSPILINSDMLYTKNETGSYEPLSIAEGVAILIHELGHHYGAYTHEELDLVSVRVSMLLQQKVISTPLIPWTSDISAQVFNPSSTSYPDVLLTIGDEVIDVSKQYAASVRCTVFAIPIPILPIPDFELVTQTPLASILHNVHWDKINEKQDSITVRIVGNASHLCAGQNGQTARFNNSKFAINFVINKVNGRYVFDHNSLMMGQFKDPWWKFIKLPH